MFFVMISFVTNKLFSQDILQPTNEKSYTEYMDNVLESLKLNDVSEFRNGILYDRVYPQARLITFNTADSINTSNYNHFRSSWNDLYKASLNPDFIDLKDVENIAYHFEKESTIQFGIINVAFTYIDTTALKPTNAKLEIVNSKIQRIANKNPYVHKTTTVIAPLNSETIRGENITFEFGKIFLEMTDKPIQELTAYFENNQTFQVITGGNTPIPPIDVPFQGSGIKTVRFDITYSDNTTLTTFSSFRLAAPLPPPITGVQTIEATKPFQGYIEPNNCNGKCLGEGEYKIYLSNQNSNLQKPFIIVDGFDPNDMRKIDEDESINEGDLNIKDMMDYDGNNLVETLNNQGFDVIILSFPKYVIRTIIIEVSGQTIEINIYRDGGVDYIERNAKVLEALIEEVNATLAINGSSEQIIVAGPSMGALVVQYALTDMEQDNEPHNTKLFVSFDGPHKGANIAIGIQKAIDYFDVAVARYALDNPAAKQMLISHYLSYSDGLPVGAPNFRNTFQNNINGLGLPEQSRNIAIINGNLTGDQKATVGGSMAHADLTAFFGFLRRTVWLNYTPYSGSNATVFRYLKRNWWGANTQLDLKKQSGSSSSFGSLDNAPGGYFATKLRIEEATGTSFPWTYQGGFGNYPDLEDVAELNFFKRLLFHLLINYIYIDLIDDFSFVPTKSALAFSGNINLWKESIGCRNMVETGETPFDSYYAPEVNQEHASLHTASVNWLLQEVNDQEQYPTIYYQDCVSDIEITDLIGFEGPFTLCGTNQITLKTNYANGGVNHYWSVDGFLIISENNGFITLQRDPNYTSNYSTLISVEINGMESTASLGCDTPLFHIGYDNNTAVKITLIDIENETPINQQAITDVEWELTSGNSYILNATAELAEFNDTYFTGVVTATNAAGSTSKTFFWPNPNICYSIVKVATDRYQVIDRCNYNEVIDAMPIKEIYDTYGNKISDLPINSQDLDIVNTGNTGDIRIIRVVVNGKQVTKMIFKD
ncbi:MAG: hypothetical protein L3J09_08480 [Flavobacteriaceae bacterium]|nr:hypothetical protein [Flavobacteriaceae bacterium]